MNPDCAKSRHVHPNDDELRKREEARYIEARLAEIGYDGDCAHEKALARYYRQRLAVMHDP